MSRIPYTTQAVIGWDNVFALGVLTASSETDPGGEKENAVDGFTYDRWIPSAGISPEFHTLTVQLEDPQTVNYLALAANNLSAQGASVTLQGSDNGEDWVTVDGPFYPQHGRPLLRRFAAGVYPWWRLTIDGDGVELGVLNAGFAFVLPEGIFVGHEPATLNPDPKIMNQMSEGGQLLGRSRIRQGAGGEIQQDRVSQDWVRTYWRPFAEFAESRPFFFAWRHDDFPDEVMYCWSNDSAKVKQEANGFMSVSIKVNGQVE